MEKRGDYRISNKNSIRVSTGNITEVASKIPYCHYNRKKR